MTDRHRPRVLILDSQPPGNRSSQLLPRFLRGLDRLSFCPILATFTHHSQSSSLQRSGIRVLRLPAHRIELFPATLATATTLGIFARLSDVRLIHSQGTLAHVHGALAAQLAGGVPELWQLEDPPSCGSRKASPLSVLDRAALSVPLDTVAGLTPSLSSPFGGALTCPIEPILQKGKISNLLSLPTAQDQNRARNRIDISDQDLLITALGRQDHFQGHENLIRIVEPLITQENLPIRLLFLGATLGGRHGYPESLRETCRQLNLESQVSFAGMQSPDQTRALIASSLCVAHAAQLPPNELTIETSLALGTPIVSCSANTSFPQFLHEKTGLLVPPSSLVSFRCALARIVKDDSLRDSLSEGARTRMEEVIDRQLGERLETMYQSLLCQPHRL